MKSPPNVSPTKDAGKQDNEEVWSKVCLTAPGMVLEEEKLWDLPDLELKK